MLFTSPVSGKNAVAHWCICTVRSVRLTRQGASQDLQSHAERAIPALRNDPDVAGQNRLCELVHHRHVLITVSKKQLYKKGYEGGE